MPHPFSDWLNRQITAVRHHNLHILSEVPDTRPAVTGRLHAIVRGHYVSPEILQQRLIDLGAPETAQLLREQLPRGKRARSGDLGEIITTEVAVHYLEYEIPVRRLRYKEAREMALRGDDVFGIKRDTDGRLRFLKGESKSRRNLSDGVVEDAAQALDKDKGRPDRVSVLFVAARLRDREQNQVATEMERALLDSFRQNVIEHMICVVSGNDPTQYLSTHINACRRQRVRHAIGLRIDDHGAFIKSIYTALNA